MPLVLTEADVKAVLPMPDLIPAMRTALAQYSSGAAQQPLRTVLEIGDRKSFFGVMPATLDDPAAVGTKLVTFGARDIGFCLHLATIVARLRHRRARRPPGWALHHRGSNTAVLPCDLLANPDARRWLFSAAEAGAQLSKRSHASGVCAMSRMESDVAQRSSATCSASTDLHAAGSAHGR